MTPPSIAAAPFGILSLLSLLVERMGVALRHQGRMETLGWPVFTLRRAIVAYPGGSSHYFVEVDDGGLRPRTVLHLTGGPLRMWEPDPETERPRSFPATRFEIVPDGQAEVIGDCLRTYTILPEGDAVEPLVADTMEWLETLGDLLITDGVEECDRPFEEYLRLSGRDPGDGATDTTSHVATSAPGDWRLAGRRALRVEGKGPDGLHYYVELADSTVLHLNGYGLRAYEPTEDQPRAFPCDVFAPLYPPRSFIEWPEGVDCLGAPLEPTLARRRLTSADHREGWVPRDWGRLDRTYEEVVAHFTGGRKRRGRRRSHTGT